ncbi:MAG: hypothetical protein ACYCXG_11070 [Acidiferrobacter sp.]
MKILMVALLLANIAVGLWGYLDAPPTRSAPPVRHRAQLRRVTPGPAALAPSPPQRAMSPASASPPPAAPAATALRAVLVTTPPVACWRLGPLASRPRAQRLFQSLRLTGRVVAAAAVVHAWRVYLGASTPRPSVATLAHLGIDGAYVARGPTGGQVLSLGVFTHIDAARRWQRQLAADHLVTRRAPLAAPRLYYDEVVMRRPPPAFWRRLGLVGHRRCRLRLR